MRIFLVLHPSGNLSVPNSKTWIKNFYEPLLDIGHEVVFLNIEQYCKENKITFRKGDFKDRFSEYLISRFNSEHQRKPFDLFLSYLTSVDIHHSVLGELGKKSIPMANFSCNNTHQFNLASEIARHFDFNLYSEKHAKSKFDGISANSIWFQMSANPTYYYPAKTSFKYDVSFVGSAYAKRVFYMKELISNGIIPDCFGPNWLINKPYPKLKKLKKEAESLLNNITHILVTDYQKRFDLSSKINYYDTLNYIRHKIKSHLHYPVPEEQMVNVFNESRINLGFLEVFTEDRTGESTIQQHLHLREFEVPMCGGLYITNYSDELVEFFEPDYEVLVYKNEIELRDKIRYYLNNEEEANRIRQNAFQRSIKEHTCQTRFKKLFKEMNINV